MLRTCPSPPSLTARPPSSTHLTPSYLPCAKFSPQREKNIGLFILFFAIRPNALLKNMNVRIFYKCTPPTLHPHPYLTQPIPTLSSPLPVVAAPHTPNFSVRHTIDSTSQLVCLMSVPTYSEWAPQSPGKRTSAIRRRLICSGPTTGEGRKSFKARGAGLTRWGGG